MSCTSVSKQATLAGGPGRPGGPGDNECALLRVQDFVPTCLDFLNCVLINYFLLQGRTPWEVCIFLSHYPQEPVCHRGKGPRGSGTSVFSSVKGAGDVGRGEVTPEKCLQTVAAMSALQLFPGLAPPASPVTSLWQAAENSLPCHGDEEFVLRSSATAKIRCSLLCPLPKVSPRLHSMGTSLPSRLPALNMTYYHGSLSL